MSNILSMAMIIVMGIIGGVSTVAITACIPVILIQKIIKKIRTGCSIYA